MSKKHWRLYILKLEQGKYYVGITTKDPERRFLEHKNNIRSAAWTRKYKPIKILQAKYLGLVTQERAEKPKT